ncbi:unnamed protein product [Rhizophagus irregularis]|uniref:Bromo domain-containing protein n=1 Tax=Rhizophagus irregularis TaxID=588596 RepID=A0A2N1NM47_9GLOM|nr:hypothetical protein RhiirC2_774185 [Rhizophagus irregularis]CAB4386699.1 unnamed protein product [Rhizophagus irregularis]
MTKWQSIDITWYTHFLDEAKRLLDPNDFITIKDKVSTEHLQYTKKLQTFWQGIIKKYEKENLLVPAETSQSNESLLSKFSETSQLTLISAETLQPDESLLSKKSFLPKVPETSQLTLTLQPDESLLPKKTVKVPNTETLQSDASLLSKMIINKIPLSESSQLNTPSLSNRQLKVPDKILSEVTQLDLPIKNNKLINFCYDIFHELENETYANLFYKYDICLIFCNCYTYNDVGSEIYNSGEALESIFNKKWNEKLIYQNKQINDLKRTRDNNTDDTDRSWKKQNQILEQNKNNLMYRQVVNDALLVASAYENLVMGNILPFIEILKTFLLIRSRMSLSIADESMFQAIV